MAQTDPESTQLAAEPSPDRPQGLGGAVPAVVAACMQASQDGSGGISNSQIVEARANLRAVTLRACLTLARQSQMRCTTFVKLDVPSGLSNLFPVFVCKIH